MPRERVCEYGPFSAGVAAATARSSSTVMASFRPDPGQDQ
jgi:hypothetical protein